MTKISDLTALTGAGVDEAADLFPIVDMSAAGAARNKKITVAEAKIALDVPTAITELDDVPDVNAPTPSNGDVLTWDSTPGEWVPTAPTTGATTLDGLTDVNAPTPGNGEVLTWDSTPGEWVSQALPGAGAFVLGDATDVDTTGAASGNVLTYDGAQWEPAAPSVAGWTVLDSYDFASGALTTREVDITGYKELYIQGVSLVNSSSVIRVISCSVDGGSNWFTTSGNYVSIDATGAAANSASVNSHTTATTSARSFTVHMLGNDGGGPPTFFSLNRGSDFRFVGSATVVNRIRLSGDATPTGSFTAGTFRVWGRA